MLVAAIGSPNRAHVVHFVKAAYPGSGALLGAMTGVPGRSVIHDLAATATGFCRIELRCDASESALSRMAVRSNTLHIDSRRGRMSAGMTACQLVSTCAWTQPYQVVRTGLSRSLTQV